MVMLLENQINDMKTVRATAAPVYSIINIDLIVIIVPLG